MQSRACLRRSPGTVLARAVFPSHENLLSKLQRSHPRSQPKDLRHLRDSVASRCFGRHTAD
jgi:hypothetical protein